MFEVMDGVMNYVAAIHLIRGYSYEAIALLRALHQIRFFNRPAEKEKKPEKKQVISICGTWEIMRLILLLQVELSTMLIEKVLQYNSARAREGKHPAAYQKIMRMAKDLLAERGIDDPNLQNGGAYTTFQARKEFNPLGQRETEQKPKSSGPAGSGNNSSGNRGGQSRGRGGQGGGQRGRQGGSRGGRSDGRAPPNRTCYAFNNGEVTPSVMRIGNKEMCRIVTEHADSSTDVRRSCLTGRGVWAAIQSGSTRLP